jgi:predicted ABC-type exoprotein transport system permease subunit
MKHFLRIGCVPSAALEFRGLLVFIRFSADGRFLIFFYVVVIVVIVLIVIGISWRHRIDEGADEPR